VQALGQLIGPEYYINYSETYAGSSGTAEFEGTALTWTAEAGSRYLVMGYMEANCSSNSYDIFVRVRRDNVEQFYYTDRVAVGATERVPFSFMQVYEGTGSAVKYNWTFQSTSGMAGKLRARLYAIRIDNLPGAHYNYSFNGGEQANVDNVFGDDAGIRTR